MAAGNNDANGGRGNMEGGRLVPIPDPTVLTTLQLDREIRNLERRFSSELSAVREYVESVKQVDQGHFERIQIQFGERDKQVTLALQGQKELSALSNEYSSQTIDKMDKTYTKLFDQMQVLLSSMERNFNDKLGDQKSRVDRMEAGKGRIDVMSIFAAIASIAGIVGVIVLLLTRR